MTLRKLMFTIAAGALAAVSAFGQTKPAAVQIKGTLNLSDGTSRSGVIRWSAKEKAYAIKVQRGTALIDELTEPENVESMDIEEPAGWDALVKAVESGKPTDAAIKRLQAVAKQYAHLQWDKEAARYLAQAYVAKGAYDEALAACRDVIKTDETAAYKGVMAPMYWQALLKKGQKSALEGALKKAIASGDRYSSGAAQIMQGDMIIDGKESDRDAAREALEEGYLRVVLMYTDAGVAERLRPEALYKASKCFEVMGMSSRASKYAGELRQLYPSSAWAQK